MEAVQCFAQDTPGTSFRKKQISSLRDSREVPLKCHHQRGFQGGRWFKVQTAFYRIYRRGIYLITYIR